MHEAQEEWVLRRAPSPDPFDLDLNDNVVYLSLFPDTAENPPHSPTPSPSGPATPSAASAPTSSPIPSSPASPDSNWTSNPPTSSYAIDERDEALDETHLLV